MAYLKYYYADDNLGTISYRSKSIWGGWLVHVSIALLMELFGYLIRAA